MSQQAHVTRIDALRHFRAVLIEYMAALRDGTELLLLEGRRGVDWVSDDRSSYWPAETRRIDEDLVSAKLELEQCQARGIGDDRPACINEKKRVNNLKERLNKARDNVGQSRTWKGKI